MLPNEDRKIGEGALKAWARQGHKEIANILPAFKDSIQIVEEPGMLSNPTSYDVSKQTGAVNEKVETAHGKTAEPEYEP